MPTTSSDSASSTASTSCIGIQNRARELARSGRDVIHLDRGELDFDTPAVITEAAVQALRERQTRYTDSSGLLELREAICAHYQRAYGVDVHPAQVLVHAGSSPLMLHLFLAILSPGDEVLLPDPGYPAYTTCVRAARGVPRLVDTRRSAFRFTASDAAGAITGATKAVVVNSPCNPTGSVLSATELADFSELGQLVVSDEAYHGLPLDAAESHSILNFTRNAVVVNTFSKTFAMTGWRLGYMIVPVDLLPRLEPLQQDCVISPNAFVQRAGVVALSEAGNAATTWRNELRHRRDVLVAGLANLGMTVPCHPAGGFYAFARMPAGQTISTEFAAKLLQEEAVAVVAGSNFGQAGEGHIRCSFTLPPNRLLEAVDRIAAFMDRN